MKFQFEDQEPTGPQVYWKTFSTHSKAKRLPMMKYLSAGVVVMAAVVVMLQHGV